MHFRLQRIKSVVPAAIHISDLFLQISNGVFAIERFRFGYR
jgi:hypothetical protein